MLLNCSNVVFILLINIKLPAIDVHVNIDEHNRFHAQLSLVEHENVL